MASTGDGTRYDPRTVLETALEQAVAGRDEGGVPIGAALFTLEGELLGAGRNRRG